MMRGQSRLATLTSGRRWGRLTTLVAAIVFATVPASAQPKKKDRPKDKPAPSDKAPDKTPDKKAEPKPKNFDFTGLDLTGRMRTPQLLYFLERANEELERASLEKRSFIPHMVRTVEEEAL